MCHVCARRGKAFPHASEVRRIGYWDGVDGLPPRKVGFHHDEYHEGYASGRKERASIKEAK